jgi:hypothetical protein
MRLTHPECDLQTRKKRQGRNDFDCRPHPEQIGDDAG